MQQINFIGRFEGATMFFIIEKIEEITLIFHKVFWVSCKMERQKIINFLNDSRNEKSEFLQKNGMP